MTPSKSITTPCRCSSTGRPERRSGRFWRRGFRLKLRGRRRSKDAALYALAAVGFKPFVPAAYRLPTVLAVALPEGFDDAGVRGTLRERYRISVTGGLGATAGKIWRLGLMGESAHVVHYARLMEALSEILAEPQLCHRFEEATAGVSVVR